MHSVSFLVKRFKYISNNIAGLIQQLNILTVMWVLAATYLLGSCKNGRNEDWRTYGGNNAGNRYSPLDQINFKNVKNLEVAWTFNAAADEQNIVPKPTRAMEIQCQPIVVDCILYATTPALKVFALEAGTGKLLWKFNPFTNSQARYRPNRGVMYWEEKGDKRILYVAGSNLFALNAETGLPINSFGINGKVELHEGLGNERYDVKDLAVTATTPGVIFKDMVIMGSTVSETGDALPGHIRAFDVRTGKMKWIFHTIPQPGEPGYETWPKDSYKKIGAANNWGGMALDEKRGIVYLGTGSPSVDFYGGDREGTNLYSNCILALNASTGKLKWYYQTIHHDLWDADMPCPPNLITVKHDGKMVDAVAQTTKDGLVHVLNRDDGTSLFPVEERAVPTDGLKGEHAWPTQKFPLKPLPLCRQYFTDSDITNISTQSHDFIAGVLKKSRSGKKFIPPSAEGTVFFGISGGAEWGGNAADPDGVLYQNVNEQAWNLKMTDMASRLKEIQSKGSALYLTNCSSCHGLDRKGSGEEYPNLLGIGRKMSTEAIKAVLESGRGRMPSFKHLAEQDRSVVADFLLNNETKVDNKASKDVKAAIEGKKEDFPYIPPYTNNGMKKLLDQDGYPSVKPPWGTLNAINLNTGDYLWRVPLGEFPELTKRGIPITGTENYGGPIVTAGGLVFIAGTKDERIRAFDKKTGKVVWEYQLPAGGFATPCTYMTDGKQYIVIAAGGARNGHKPGGSYIAFALK